MSNQIGTGRRRRKLGEIVAELLIEEIIRRGWPVGEVLGTEADFMDRFRISRATFREAVRQLEWQGMAGMRRGASGGLDVRALPRHAIVASCKTYFELTQIDDHERQEADRVLASSPRLRESAEPNEAIALFREALDERSVADLAELRRGSATPKLSESVTMQLVQMIAQLGVIKGTPLGNEEDLRKRYQVSRAVLREALRPLELHDIIRTKTGAQGGIVIHRCDPGYTVDLTTNYLSYARIPLSHLWEAQSSLSIHCAARVATADDAEFVRQLQRANDRLAQARPANYLIAASDFHTLIAVGSGNRAMALFASVLQQYGAKVLPQPEDRFLPALKSLHSHLLAAIIRRSPNDSQIFMRDLFEHSRRWIAAIERKQVQRQPQPPG